MDVSEEEVNEKDEHKEYHTLIIRNIPDKLYQRLYNVKAKFKAKSWKQLLDALTKEFEEEVKEMEWI